MQSTWLPTLRHDTHKEVVGSNHLASQRLVIRINAAYLQLIPYYSGLKNATR